MIQQCPKGPLLDICLSHFLKVIQGQENHNVDNDSDDKDDKDINNKMENTQRKIAALDAISDLFLSESENENTEDILPTSTSSAHVHTASCNHGHHNDTPAVR